MPPPFDELSLRHLPDISNASFSFQIPSSSTGDLLLENDEEDDFFQNADDTMGTPGPSRRSQTPLTLSELTPKPQARAYQEPSPPHDQPPKPQDEQNPRGLGRAPQARPAHPRATKQPTLKVTTPLDELRGPEASPRAARLRTLKAEVDLLSDDSQGSAIPPGSPSAHAHAHAHEPALGGGQPPGSKQERLTARPKQVVFSGGISKARSRPARAARTTAATAATTAPPAPQSQAPQAPVQEQEVHHATSEGENPDLSVCSTTSGGVAERLVMYSQKLIGSFGLFNTDKVSPQSGVISPGSHETCPPAEEEAIAHVGLQGDHASRNEDDSRSHFTLSQLSPRKPTSQPQPQPQHRSPVSPATTPASPMRPSRKRPGSVASSHQPSSKRGKTAAPAAGAAHAPPNAISASKKTLAGSHSGSASASARPGVGGARGAGRRATRQVPATRPGAGEGRLGSSASASASGSTATLRASRGEDRCGGSAADLGGSARLGAGTPPGAGAGAGSSRVAGAHDADLDLGADADTDGRRDTRVVLPPVNPTRPVGFRFGLDARMEARKAEHEKEKEKEGLGTVLQKKQYQQQHHQPQQQHTDHLARVPDFKSLHAQLDAARALRKENVQPVVPLPVALCTDARAREREKFDLRVREREREMERAREERRRAQEEEEEREVRELRRRAVPRAHEVPEWYREAPKRRVRGEGGDGVGE